MMHGARETALFFLTDSHQTCLAMRARFDLDKDHDIAPHRDDINLAAMSRVAQGEYAVSLYQEKSRCNPFGQKTEPVGFSPS
jgi:hypothetical protein